MTPEEYKKWAPADEERKILLMEKDVIVGDITFDPIQYDQLMDWYNALISMKKERRQMLAKIREQDDQIAGLRKLIEVSEILKK